VYCSVLQGVAVLHCGVAARCKVLQRVAGCCSVLQCVAVTDKTSTKSHFHVDCAADCYKVVLQGVAECGSVLQYFAV